MLLLAVTKDALCRFICVSRFYFVTAPESLRLLTLVMTLYKTKPVVLGNAGIAPDCFIQTL